MKLVASVQSYPELNMGVRSSDASLLDESLQNLQRMCHHGIHKCPFLVVFLLGGCLQYNIKQAWAEHGQTQVKVRFRLDRR